MQSAKASSRRIRFWLQLIKAYILRYRYPFLVSLLTFLVIAYTAFRLWPKITRSNIVTIGYVGSYTLETIPAEVLNLATQSLITVDESGRPIPSLASHWTVSDDGKTYIVFLKDNLVWHDGTQVDAKDITIAIENVKISALNNKAIEFKLPNPIASFPTALNKPVFKSKTFYGTGEFRISQIESTEGVIQKVKMSPKQKGLPRVEISFYQTENQLTSAIKIGQVKYATVANAKIFESWPNLEVQREIANHEIVAIFYNTEDPALASKELRQALTHSINRSGFDGIAAISPTSPTSWAYNNDVKRYDYNTGRAKELLAKSQVKNPQVTLSVVGGFTELARSIQNDWQDLGIEVEINEEKMIPKNFQALLVVDKIPPDPDQYGLWHSTQRATNLTRYKDVKIDKLLEDARITQDEETRKQLYFDFQRFLVEDTPIALLYHPYKYQVTYKNLKPLIEKLPK